MGLVGKIILILGALCFFIYGMKLMSDGIQRAAGNQLRRVLRSMTKNRYLGVFTGFLTTAVIQSSSATTVMTVSFVNAGLLTLVESAGIMMGANIGTTITAWIISYFGFKVKMSAFSIPLFAFGVPMLLSNRGRLKHWGEFIIGFAILFLGLTYLKDAVPDLSDNNGFFAWVNQFASHGFFSRVFFVLVGALITIIVQSSSAAMAITLTLVYKGWLPLDVATAMILGENIGTTITAELASLVGNVHAKRSARIHSLFNIIGVTWMIILIPFVLDFLTSFVQNFSYIFEGHVKVEDDLSSENLMNTYILAAFHTFFNLTNVILLIGFVPWLVKVATVSVKSKGEEDEVIKLVHLGNAGPTPELAIVELQKEIARYCELTTRMLGYSKELINSKEKSYSKNMIKKIKRYEEVTDKFEKEITEYITKLSDAEMSHQTSVRLRSFFNICNDLERIGDLFYQLSKTMNQKMKKQLWFTPEQRTQLNELIEIVDRAFAEMNSNINRESLDITELTTCYELEDEINKKRNKMRDYNQENLGKEDYNLSSSLIFTNLFSYLERVGDHIVNINESIAGEI